MSGQDALDVIAEAINDDGWTCDVHEPHRFGECTPCRDAQTHTAQAALDALTDAGYAIVKLPEQMTDRSAVCASIKDWPMRQLGDSWAAVDAEGDIEVETDSQTANVSGMSITDAMNLACVVLAAAAHAEAGEDRG